MSSGINTVAISGNLGRDPELRAARSGTQVLRFSVCVNERRKVGDEWQDVPNWVDVTVFGKRAEALNRYLSKGTHVCVQGRLRQSKWEKDGQKHSRLEVIADNVTFSGGAKRDDVPDEVYDDDCPF